MAAAKKVPVFNSANRRASSLPHVPRFNTFAPQFNVQWKY